MTNKQERRIQIKRLEALINGETVDGLKLNDPGLGYERMMMTLATLREEERQAGRPSYRMEAVEFAPGIAVLIPVSND